MYWTATEFHPEGAAQIRGQGSLTQIPGELPDSRSFRRSRRCSVNSPRLVQPDAVRQWFGGTTTCVSVLARSSSGDSATSHHVTEQAKNKSSSQTLQSIGRSQMLIDRSPERQRGGVSSDRALDDNTIPQKAYFGTPKASFPRWSTGDDVSPEKSKCIVSAQKTPSPPAFCSKGNPESRQRFFGTPPWSPSHTLMGTDPIAETFKAKRARNEPRSCSWMSTWSSLSGGRSWWSFPSGDIHDNDSHVAMPLCVPVQKIISYACRLGNWC